jgi:AcrR family transcriptional regulator
VRRARAVLDAAAAVFARQGYDSTSIDDIADELGSTKGRVYHYYRSKIELLIGVVNTGTQDLIDEIRPIATDASLDPAAKLRAMARAHAMEMMTNHAYQYVNLRHMEPRLFEERGPGKDTWQDIRALRAEYEGLFTRVVEEGAGSGAFAVPDVPYAVRGILGALNWITVWYRPGPDGKVDPESADRVADSLSEFVVAGVRGGA